VSMDTRIMGLVTALYMAAFFLLVIYSIARGRIWKNIGLTVAVGGFALHTIGLGMRWLASYRLGIGHAPLSNLYESLVFFAWAIVLIGLGIARRRTRSMTAVYSMPAAALLMAYASFAPGIDSTIQPLIPALKSNWLAIHVMTCFLGYAAFVVGSLLGIGYLMKRKQDSSDAAPIGNMAYQCIAIGFILFTFGILTGAVWAYAAWGRYWGWDPKETWALITWLAYAATLHVRLRDGGINPKVVGMALFGLACILFTYFGVNYLQGLHSYF